MQGDVEGQNVEVRMRKKIPLVFYNELMSSCENKLYIELFTKGAGRCIGW